MLERQGQFEALRIAAGRAQGKPRGPVFSDSDVYKWAEALCWELGREDDAELAHLLDQTCELVAAAQRPDGYLNSHHLQQARREYAESGGEWVLIDERAIEYGEGGADDVEVERRESFEWQDGRMTKRIGYGRSGNPAFSWAITSDEAGRVSLEEFQLVSRDFVQGELRYEYECSE